MFIHRIRPLVASLLTALTITGATAGVAVVASTQGQHHAARPAAARWCVPGAPGCPLQTGVAG
jgi:hypothetical protein